MKKSVIFFILAIGFSFCSCNRSADTKDAISVNNTEPIGKYIYRDDNGVCHINPRCNALRYGKDDKGHEIYAKHPMDTSEFVIINHEHIRVCSRCVDDKAYEKIITISRRNILESRRWLYNKLVEADYDMPDYETYDSRLDDFEVRRDLFRIAREEQWYVGTFDEFSAVLGFKNY